MDTRDDDAINEEHMMYGHGTMTEQELNEKYPNRPHNHAKTLPFHELFLTLFNPLNENKKKPTGPLAVRRKGVNGPKLTPNDVRKSIIGSFIVRWRKECGNDIYPAFRLIIPEKDRDRAMYGLKEMAIAKLLVRVMKIDKNSEDAQNLLHWKLPGLKSSSAMAGDFAGRCFEVISKRPMRNAVGDMNIAEVNEQLDRLSVAQKDEDRLPIMQDFYNRMNAEELMWLIRMILRQMKVGATEKTIFEIWHPDAESLFNISSSLRRVCWELYDQSVRLEGEDRGISLMQCFQPQLAAFQMRSVEQMVARMKPTETDSVFWIEEKLDGERMQLHMVEDDEVAGGKRFSFWSRKAKNYTYLYGEGFEDQNAALTRHIKDAFDPGVRNIILDGEMITWDPQEDCIVGFGTLKTAALLEQKNPYSQGNRPFFKVFDCLYLNDTNLSRYTLRKRCEALSKSVNNVERRLEIHGYTEAQDASQVEPLLRKVVAESSEGLVLKNPRSEYRLNERNDDWIKVKPEYMTEFGEALDCIVVGGYYGSGHRGGGLSSFMCGLPVYDYVTPVPEGGNPQKCLSFFKVGGGMTASDYAEIRHKTEGKWIDWDRQRPPIEYVELAGGDRQHEKPDVWIKPEDSVVLAVKAAQITGSDQFKTGLTLRFPRFKKLRSDKDWKSALTLNEFKQLKYQIDHDQQEKQFKIDDERRKRGNRTKKRKTVIQGQDEVATAPYAGPATKVFDGMKFLIATEAMKPKKTKADLAQLVKANGGTVVASEKDPETIIIADRNPLKIASLQKSDTRNIIRPSWLLDCVKQSEIDFGRPKFLLPLEPQHLFFTTSADLGKFDDNVDEYGDSYTKDITAEELHAFFDEMPSKFDDEYVSKDLLEQLNDHGHDLDAMPGFMFNGVRALCEDVPAEATRLIAFAGGEIVDTIDDEQLTHIIFPTGSNKLKEIRKSLSSRQKLPRIVTTDWVLDSWNEKTKLDEERRSSIAPCLSLY